MITEYTELLEDKELQKLNNTNTMEVKVKMEYEAELKRLQEGGNFWKPKAGQYQIKALTELQQAEPYIRNKGTEMEEKNEQFKLMIEVSGEKKSWTFGKGATLASTYGQLVNLASNRGNKLQGQEFSVIVKSDGTKNDYTIVI